MPFGDVFALALLPKAKAVFALALLDVDDCDCRGKLPLLEEMTALGTESLGS